MLGGAIAIIRLPSCRIITTIWMVAYDAILVINWDDFHARFVARARH